MSTKPPSEASLKAGHETTDGNPIGIWLTGLGLFLCVLLILLTVSGIFHHFQRQHDALNLAAASQQTAPGVSDFIPKFPAPRLQVAPPLDLATFRAREDMELNTYGWIDKQTGAVRIPIEVAMDLIAQRGLPVRGQAGVPVPTRTVLDIQQSRPSDWAKQKQPQ